MTKINITKPTGNIDSLNIVTAFKAEENTYVVLDSEKMGSMGLPIIYVSKYTNKLEKINDQNEWQSVKNYLKGIISGTNFQYIKINNNIIADEAYYTPLTLPQSSFDVIKNRYVVDESSSNDTATLNKTIVTPNPNVTSNTTINVNPVMSNNTDPTSEEQTSVLNLIDEAYKKPINNIPVNQVNQENNPNLFKNNTINNADIPKTQSEVINSTSNHELMNFANDKETFLKACENMFDALVSKYQKEYTELKQKEQELIKKETEINNKLKDANEHLANAEAREQVANIAHDNAKKVMDLNNFMPVNPNSNS